MHAYGLAVIDGDVTFYPPENPEHVSHSMLERPETANRVISVPVRSLPSIMKELGHESIDVLKMDIEGAEYDVLDALIASGTRPKQLLVEFHHRFLNLGMAPTRRAIGLLRREGYRLFSVSPTVEEFCFIR
jgi:FkbM family methyltransferase